MSENYLRGMLAQQPQNSLTQFGGGMLSPATANPNMLAQAMRAREQPRNMLVGPTTGTETAQYAGMVPGLGLLGVGGDVSQYIQQPETRNWLNYALTAAGALPFLGAMAKMAGNAPAGLLRSQAGIISKDAAKALNTTRSLPQSDVFSAAVKNTPGASITEDGLVMSVQRNQLPEQALQPSVRGGTFYLPQGAEQAKHYSTGRSGYGGSERISGETLFSNPLLAKGGTGGKAPQMAYDSLNGKGAYEAMREDALRVRHPDLIKQRGDSLRGAISPEDFLSKYAPELSGKGDYIFNKSRQGNQLAYALQEAAVASAARRAGHDAVIGYSTKRTTKEPFLSEIFDVREMNYPDKFGTPTDIWDSFK